MDSMKNDFKELSEDELERQHFIKVLNAFKYYKNHSLQRVHSSERYLQSLPEKHRELLSGYSIHLDRVKAAIKSNHEILKLIVNDVTHIFDNVQYSEDAVVKADTNATNMDMEKVQSTIRQFVRDWSEDGAEERKLCYSPIVEEIEALFPISSNSSEICILVPGAGLGRLAFEIAKRGYTCQGNEFSLFMLFASNFVLNKCQRINSCTIYPWVHQYCNNLRAEDQLHPAKFPDVNPSNLPPNSKFSMAAGDFLEVYTERDYWDCIATCFFIDTARNIVEYIETIWNILKPGGVWINLGPLLYHFADMAKENSIEPSYEELKGIIKKYGFTFLKEKTHLDTSYSQNPRCMLRYAFQSVFFVCRKPA